MPDKKLQVDLLDRGPLSKREAEVLCFWLSGETHKRIADRLFVTTKTVEAHIEHIKAKLDTRNQMVAMKDAEERGLVRCRLVKILCIAVFVAVLPVRLHSVYMSAAIREDIHISAGA